MSNPPQQPAQILPRSEYPSDVTTRQWEQIDLLLPADAARGRHREYSLRDVVNAVNYRWLTGCSWRMLPHDYPPWQTVYSYFRQWQRAGLLSPLREILISRSLRMSRSTRTASLGTDDDSGQTTALNPAARSAASERETSSWTAEPPFSHSRS